MQKFLFIFAHPDDETVACGGTIKRLSEAGKDVRIVSVTNGGAGQVMPGAQSKLAHYLNVGALRKAEFESVCELLGAEPKLLHFEDGQITNEIVWGQLLSTLIDEIDAYQPDVLVTFDHSGWYFHLDHVGVSIATTLAAKKAAAPPALFFHAHYRPVGVEKKWHYVFADTMPITHEVDVTAYKDVKLQAMDLHQSQELNIPRQHLKDSQKYTETFQLIFSDQNGEKWLNNQDLFIRSK